MNPSAPIPGGPPPSITLLDQAVQEIERLTRERAALAGVVKAVGEELLGIYDKGFLDYSYSRLDLADLRAQLARVPASEDTTPRPGGRE